MRRPTNEKPGKVERAYLFQLLSDYPSIKKWMRENREAMMPSSTPNYGSSNVMSGGESRPTESLAIKIISDRTLAMWEWKIQAVDNTISKLDDIDRRIVELVFWDSPQKTYAQAGEIISMSPQGIKYRVDNIIALLAFYFGENRPKGLEDD